MPRRSTREIHANAPEAPVDATAQRLLNLLFILNGARHPLPTSQIISDSDLGYGSGNRRSDERKFRRDRAKLAEQGIIINEVHPAGTAETEESCWEIDRAHTFAAGGLIEEEDARALVRAIDEYLEVHATPLAKPLRAVRAKAVEAVAARRGEFPHDAFPHVLDRTTDPVADAAWSALTLRRRFVFSYANAAGESSRRSVAIYGIFSYGDTAYFTGHDDKSDEVRTFRIDRVVRVWSPGEGYRLPEGFSLADHLFLPFDLSSAAPSEAVFRFPSARTAHELERITHGRGRLAHEAEDGRHWTVEVRDTDAAAAFALAHARDGMRPVAPKDLVRAWKAAIERTVQTTHGH